jgi:L,D-transpeptidase YbiS
MVIDAIEINLKKQICRVSAGRESIDYPCSTGLKGAGEREGSGCTPRGLHRVRAVIGRGMSAKTVFVGRRPTGELWNSSLHLASPERDWILGRILWLCGNELGFNRGGSVDSQRRFIYIHGTPRTEPMNVPKSHGCIRMRPDDLIEFADYVCHGCPVLILEF